MKTSIDVHAFVQAFQDAGRGDQFTLTGMVALFDYLEGYEQGTGVEIELDVVRLSGDFGEYADLAEIQETYPEVKDMDDLEESTHVIVTESTIIIWEY